MFTPQPILKIENEQEFRLVWDKFFQGYAPAFYENSKSEFGNPGHANAMANVNILDPTFLTQGPGLSKLTNGDENGVVDEKINFILDRAVSDNVTYGIGATKLFKIGAGAVTDETGVWPHAITNCTEGCSIVLSKGAVYYFFNKSSGGDIGKLTTPATFDDDWGSTIPTTGKGALQTAPHPAAQKEDMIGFGNGRYFGLYMGETDELALTKLDFGESAEVADVLFHANFWVLAVNSPNLTGNNRNFAQIYYYDGSGVSSMLSDEAALGVKRIGWIMVNNGIVFVCYQDHSSSGYRIGYISGRSIKPIGAFAGSLPDYQQKTLYKETILTMSGANIISCGAISDDLPIQTSHLTTADYSTHIGALAAPFGTPMVCSDNGSNYKLSKFSGYRKDSNWTTLISQIAQGRFTGRINEIIVITNVLGTGAQLDITIKINQEASSETVSITPDTNSPIRHSKRINLNNVVDLRLYLNWANGSITNPVQVRRIEAIGQFIEA